MIFPIGCGTRSGGVSWTFGGLKIQLGEDADIDTSGTPAMKVPLSDKGDDVAMRDDRRARQDYTPLLRNRSNSALCGSRLHSAGIQTDLRPKPLGNLARRVLEYHVRNGKRT